MFPEVFWYLVRKKCVICDELSSEISDKFLSRTYPSDNFLSGIHPSDKFLSGIIISEQNQKLIKMVKIVVDTFGEEALRKLYCDLDQNEFRWDKECELCKMPIL